MENCIKKKWYRGDSWKFHEKLFLFRVKSENNEENKMKNTSSFAIAFL